MEGLEALLSSLKRALTPGSAEAPLAWLLVVVVVLLLALGVLLLLRRPSRARNEVEHFFLASAAATRKAREISEIDAFARARFRIGGGSQGPRAQAAHRALPAGQDLHRPFQLHPHLDAGRAQPRPAAGARHQLDDLAASADGGDERVAVEGAQEPAGTALSRHQRLRHAVPGGLLQAARDHAAAGADGARQAAPADPPAQGDGGALARGERGAQGRADARNPAGDGLPDGADLPPHAARGPAALVQLHGRRHPDRAGEDAGHAHRHRPDRRRHLRRLRHRPHRLGGQRLRAGRRFRAGDAQQAGGARGLRQPHERAAQQMPAPHRPRPGSPVPPRAGGRDGAETARTQKAAGNTGAAGTRPQGGGQA